MAVEAEHKEGFPVEAAEGIVDYAAARGLIGWEDRIWACNSVLAILGAGGPGPDDGWSLASGTAGPSVTDGTAAETPDRCLEALADYAVAQGVRKIPPADATASRWRSWGGSCRGHPRWQHPSTGSQRRRTPRPQLAGSFRLLRCRLRAAHGDSTQHLLGERKPLGCARDYDQPLEARKGSPRDRCCRQGTDRRKISHLPALHRE